MTTRALVLSGGGVAGIAWQTGMIVGMTEAGLDVRNADLFVGTSAGSCTAPQILSGLPLDELFQRQVDPALQARELEAHFDLQRMGAAFARITEGTREATVILQRTGAEALAAPTVTEAERRKVIVSRLPVHSWPQKPLLISAIDVHSGERRVFKRADGVDLVDAVAASCAVPLIWPPVSIEGHRYMDGGIYSNENADLAAGFDRVLILALDAPPFSVITLETQLEQLRSRGSQVEVVRPGEAMKAVVASVGGNLLAPEARSLAAQAGLEEGRAVAARLAALWR